MVYKFNKIKVLLKMYYLALDSIPQHFVLTQVSAVRVKYEGGIYKLWGGYFAFFVCFLFSSAGLTQLVEGLTAEQEVMGSTPWTRPILRVLK